jgi:hypothetical protein
MQGITEAIKYLYQQFILRDVVAYVTPGSVLAACLLGVHLGGVEPTIDFIKGIPAIAYAPIYGLLFTVGLGIENFGEMIKLLRSTVRADETEHLNKLQEFHRAVLSRRVSKRMVNEYSDVLERTRERIEVKKYAAGNIALAIVMGTIFIGITKTFPNSWNWAILAVVEILAISLIRAHLVQVKNVKIWEEGASKSHKIEELGI